MDSADQEDSINRIKFTEETVFGAPIEMQNLNKVQGIIIRLRKNENVEKSKNILIAMLEELLKKEAVADKKLISLFCNLWYYMTSIRISSIILLFFSLLISMYVISITTLIRRNIPITKVPHGI